MYYTIFKVIVFGDEGCGKDDIFNRYLTNIYNCCNNAIFVNREQDLGVSGLRRAKESYKPVRMVKKSIIYRNRS